MYGRNILLPSKFPVFFNPEEQYKQMRSSPLSAMVQRLLQDRIETMNRCSTASEDPTNAGLHAHADTFPYLVVTKISIQLHPAAMFEFRHLY